MRNVIEEEIVKKYIKKNKQDRILWELDNPKKRGNVIWRMNRSDIFKESCLQPVGYMTKEIMKKYFYELSGVRKVYFIGEDFIGHLSIEQAVERANTGEVCIIYCGKGIGYYQGEQEIGKPPRFLLIQKE